MGYRGAMHDESYKRLFASTRMVEDLVRGFAGGAWLAGADFTSLERLSSEYVSDELRRRHGDVVWRLRLGGRWAYLLVLLEFQSRTDPLMALRIHEYTLGVYREVARNGSRGPGARLPAVLPVVLYNGASRWTAAAELGELIEPVGAELRAYQPSQRYLVVDERRVEEDDLPAGNLMRAVVGLERSGSPEDLRRVVEWLQGRLGAPVDAELRGAFVDWVMRLAGRLTPGGESQGAAVVRTLEEARVTLEERVAQWPKQWFREGREEGLEQGREQGLEQGEQGLEQGREQGLEQGLAHERALLVRMAATRFGPEIGERLSGVLAGIADPEGLAEVGERLVRSETGDELLAPPPAPTIELSPAPAIPARPARPPSPSRRRSPLVAAITPLPPSAGSAASPVPAPPSSRPDACAGPLAAGGRLREDPAGCTDPGWKPFMPR